MPSSGLNPASGEPLRWGRGWRCAGGGLDRARSRNTPATGGTNPALRSKGPSLSQKAYLNNLFQI